MLPFCRFAYCSFFVLGARCKQCVQGVLYPPWDQGVLVSRTTERLYRRLPCSNLACTCRIWCLRSLLGRLVKQHIERVLDTSRFQDEFVSRPAERLDIWSLHCTAVFWLGIFSDCCQRVKIKLRKPSWPAFRSWHISCTSA